MIATKLILIVIIGYSLGSIPFGVLLGKWLKGIDVREYGSGKMGAANVQRALGWKAGALVLVLDVVKSGLAVVLAGLLMANSEAQLGAVSFNIRLAQSIAAMAAMTGHIWPLPLKFRGGRGVTTFFGGLLAMSPIAGAFGAEIFFITAGITGYVSLGSILGAAASYAILLPLVFFAHYPAELLLFSVIGMALIIYQHRDNIHRLQIGKERRLSERLGRA